MVRRYAASDDPRVARANFIALLLASNTPFYPLYVFAAGGAGMWPGAWLTLCSFPFFLAVPAITRRNRWVGRIFLAFAGLLNTLFCTWVLGEASGTELFLLPCIILAALLFRRAERMTLVVMLYAPVAAGLALFGRYAESPFACTGAACGGILWMNAMSVAVLLALFGYMATEVE
jgi:hypothetical protein